MMRNIGNHFSLIADEFDVLACIAGTRTMNGKEIPHAVQLTISHDHALMLARSLIELVESAPFPDARAVDTPVSSARASLNAALASARVASDTRSRNAIVAIARYCDSEHEAKGGV